MHEIVIGTGITSVEHITGLASACLFDLPGHTYRRIMSTFGGRYAFESNERPVTVINSEAGIELGSEASNFHMLAFSWFDDHIIVNITTMK